MKIFRQSLRGKLIGVFLVPTLLVVSLLGSLAYFAVRQSLEEELGKRLVSIGETISADMSEGFDAKQIARLDESKARVLARMQERLESTRRRTKVRRLYLFGADRGGLVDTDKSVSFGQRLYELDAHQSEVEAVFASASPRASVLFEGPDGLLYKTAFVPVTLEGRTVAALGVEASASYFELLTDFGTLLWALGLMGLVLVVVAATVFSRRLVRPINDLVGAAHRVGRGDLETPIDVADDEGDEIDFLARAMEEMRRDIVGRDEQMQMMLSGIAHEVRNPLGGMELFCGLLAEDIHDLSAENGPQMLEKVGKIQRELDYLERVVSDFLDFARRTPLELERFDAAAFVDELSDLLRGEVVDSGSTLETSVTADLELTADRHRLRRAVINVVRNAYQACGTGGTVRIEAYAEEGMRVVRVLDDGPGIDDAMIEDVLTPFFTTKEKGSGLGLALTRRIMEQHDGALSLARGADGEGTVVELRWPFDASLEAVSAQIPEGWLG